MRIGIDIRPLEEAQPTGVGEYTREVVTGMLALAPEHEFRLYASGARQVELPDLGQDKHKHATVKWLQRPNKILSASTVVARKPLLDQVLGGLDVFFSPNLNFTALSSKVPHVLTAHDLSYELFPQFFSLRRRVWHRAVRARHAVQSAAHVLCDSRSTSDDVVTTYGVAREKTTVVPLGVSANFSPKADEAVEQRVRKEHELPERYLLTVGTLEPRKNLVSLLQAYEQLRRRVQEPIALVVAGPDGWKSRAFWRALESEQLRDVADDIHVLGFIPSHDRPALIRAATCVVVPSSYEGFGLPALEAMACGVPVVASRASSLPEVTADAALLVDPERPTQLADALAAVVSNDALRQQLITAGLAQAQHFSWQKTARTTLNVLEAVVDNRRWQLEPTSARSAMAVRA